MASPSVRLLGDVASKGVDVAGVRPTVYELLDLEVSDEVGCAEKSESASSSDASSASWASLSRLLDFEPRLRDTFFR